MKKDDFTMKKSSISIYQQQIAPLMYDVFQMRKIFIHIPGRDGTFDDFKAVQFQTIKEINDELVLRRRKSN